MQKLEQIVDRLGREADALEARANHLAGLSAASATRSLRYVEKINAEMERVLRQAARSASDGGRARPASRPVREERSAPVAQSSRPVASASSGLTRSPLTQREQSRQERKRFIEELSKILCCPTKEIQHMETVLADKLTAMHQMLNDVLGDIRDDVNDILVEVQLLRSLMVRQVALSEKMLGELVKQTLSLREILNYLAVSSTYNPYVQANGDQGDRENWEVQRWFRDQGYEGNWDYASAIRWAGSNDIFSDYLSYIRGNGAVPDHHSTVAELDAWLLGISDNGMSGNGWQGSQRNEDAEFWFQQHGYAGPFGGGQALQWAATQFPDGAGGRNLLQEYFDWAGISQANYLSNTANPEPQLSPLPGELPKINQGLSDILDALRDIEADIEGMINLFGTMMPDNTYVQQNGLQGGRDAASVQRWFREMGYRGSWGSGQALRWAGQAGRFDDYMSFIHSEDPAPAAPMTDAELYKWASGLGDNPWSDGSGWQGAYSNRDVEQWFADHGYTGAYGGAAAVQWAALNNILDEFIDWSGADWEVATGAHTTPVPGITTPLQNAVSTLGDVVDALRDLEVLLSSIRQSLTTMTTHLNVIQTTLNQILGVLTNNPPASAADMLNQLASMLQTNPFVQSNGNQGTQTNAAVQRWFRDQGYTGRWDDGEALRWAGSNSLFDDYFGFITHTGGVPDYPRTRDELWNGVQGWQSNAWSINGMQGNQPNEAVAEWFGQHGYTGAFSNAEAIRWAAQNGLLGEYIDWSGRDWNDLGFATGGSFQVRGPAGRDQLSLPNLRVTAGEVVNVSRGDHMADMVQELRALRSDTSGLFDRLIRLEAAAGQGTIDRLDRVASATESQARMRDLAEARVA